MTNPFYSGGQYTTTQIRKWARTLRYFRLCGSHGGHFDDGDSLRVLLAFPTIEAAQAALESHGSTLTRREPHSASTFGHIDGIEVYLATATPNLVSIQATEGATDAYVRAGRYTRVK